MHYNLLCLESSSQTLKIKVIARLLTVLLMSKFVYGWYLGRGGLGVVNLYNVNIAFYTPVSRRGVLCDWVWRAGGRRASTQVSAQ